MIIGIIEQQATMLKLKAILAICCIAFLIPVDCPRFCDFFHQLPFHCHPLLYCVAAGQLGQNVNAVIVIGPQTTFISFFLVDNGWKHKSTTKGNVFYCVFLNFFVGVVVMAPLRMTSLPLPNDSKEIWSNEWVLTVSTRPRFERNYYCNVGDAESTAQWWTRCGATVTLTKTCR